MLRNHLYRTLLKLGKKFDKNPRYKAFIFTSEARFPVSATNDDDDDDFERDYDIVMHTNAEKVMKHYVDSVCTPGLFYKPQVSLAQIVRNGFRQPSPVELTTVEQHQLGFMAVRLLFNCERLGNEASSIVINTPEPILPAASDAANQIIAVEPADASIAAKESSFSSTSSTASAPLLVQADKLEPGVLLISHPLCVERPLGNAIVLVTHVSEDHCSGMILNKEYKENFKTLLDKRERIRYGYYLKEFYECACFNGGEGEYMSAMNYCILHQQDSLAEHSERIELSDGKALQALFGDDVMECEGDSVDGTAKEHTADGHGAANGTGAGTDSTSQQQSGQRKTYVYFSHDFQAISKELAKGTVKKSDIKIVRGITDWTDGELQESIADQKFWMVRPSSGSSGSGGGGDEASVGSAGSVLSDMVMARPVPQDYTSVNLSDTGGWEDPTLWVSGNYAWCKALYSMGGEYRDIARLHTINSSDKAETYIDILRNLTEYGKREYPAHARLDEDSDGDDDSDFDDADFATALELLDEDGNPSGELIISASVLDEEDEHGEDFSDDDDDE